VILIADLANAENQLATDINSGNVALKELGENVSDLMARVAVNLIYNTDYPIYHLNPQI